MLRFGYALPLQSVRHGTKYSKIRSNHEEVFREKKVFWDFFPNWQENICAKSLFSSLYLNKVGGCRFLILLTRDSSTFAFLRISQKISKQKTKKLMFFYKTQLPLTAETAVQRCSSEKVFWKYATNLQENSHAEVRF